MESADVHLKLGSKKCCHNSAKNSENPGRSLVGPKTSFLSVANGLDFSMPHKFEFDNHIPNCISLLP